MADEVITITANPTFRGLARVFKTPVTKFVGFRTGKAAGIVKVNLRRTTPKKTRRLVNSQFLRQTGSTEWTIGERVDPPYGFFQRQGVPARKINPILPRRKKALFWEGARHPVAAVYKHPGIKPNPYFQRAIDMSQAGMKKEANRITGDIEAQIEEAQ
jgi:hypothetical protein